MRDLSPVFESDLDYLSGRLIELAGELEDPILDVSGIRNHLESEGFRIRSFTPKSDPGQKSFFCVDSSFGRLDLRFNSLYCVHTVGVSARFSPKASEDVLVGQGTVHYEKLEYASKIDVGVLKPYAEAERLLSLARLREELAFLEDAGEGFDFLVLDGSLSALDYELKANEDKGEESSKFFKSLLKKNTVSMAEDSHSSNISGRLGSHLTNNHLFDLVLKPLEYVVVEDEEYSTVYLKLPSKRMLVNPAGTSDPFTVRWEFSKKEFIEDLESIVAIWLFEDDLVHPQIYPLRIADYLTRKIKIHGILKDFAGNSNLKAQFRDLRQV